MKKLLTFALCTFMVFTIQAQDKEPAKIAGEWVLTMSTPRGERSGDITITQEGSEAVAETEEDQEFEISIDGNEVSWTQTLSTPMGEIEVKFEGTVDGNEMEGTATMSGGPMEGQEMDWTATRKEED